jgi:hypothetical protein
MLQIQMNHLNQIQKTQLMKINQINKEKPILKGGNIDFVTMGILIFILLPGLIFGSYNYNPILSVFVILAFFILLSRFHYICYFFKDEIILRNPLYFWKKHNYKAYKYSDIKEFNFHPVALNTSPHILLILKDKKIMVNTGSIGYEMKKLIRVLEKNSVKTKGIDMEKYGSKTNDINIE